MARRVLLLIPTTSYKTADFMQAAERLGIEVVVGTDMRQALEEQMPGHTLALDFVDVQRGLGDIRELARERPLAAVIGTDDETTLLATMASAALGLAHNPVEAVATTRNKHRMRSRLREAGRPGPDFELIALDADPLAAAERTRYPCVLKPLSLSAGRGVMRADDSRQFVEAFRRIGQILQDPEIDRLKGATEHLLVESYLPGEEFALEGLLEQGRLRTLAVFDKPEPLEGPTFEETLFITPSRQPAEVQRAIVAEAASGCAALSLQDGPVHAELRLTDGRPWLIEIAARTIGGLCSRTLRFGTGMTLEELVLRHALAMETAAPEREARAAGVMMLPIPRAGILRDIHGIDDARGTPDIEDVTISLHKDAELVPLPEGHRYLGFIFARAATPERVEAALRRAHAKLRFEIDAA